MVVLDWKGRCSEDLHWKCALDRLLSSLSKTNVRFGYTYMTAPGDRLQLPLIIEIQFS